MIALFKVVTMVATLLVAALGVLYVLEFFSDEQVRDLIEKAMKISAIFVGAGTVVVLLYGGKK